jgi:hypothetical protein
MKLTSSLVSGAVALAMAGAIPAWADTAAQPAAAPSTGKSAAHSHGPARDSARLRLAQATNPTAGQTSGSQPSPQLQEVVVTGIRQSMESALHLKEFADTIEDSIVATDIGKLPDVTAIDAIQRIPGVQISRQLGEGGGTVTIGGSAVMSGYEIRRVAHRRRCGSAVRTARKMDARPLDLRRRSELHGGDRASQ